MIVELSFSRKKHDALLNTNKYFKEALLDKKITRSWGMYGVTLKLFDGNAYENGIIDELISVADVKLVKDGGY